MESTIEAPFITKTEELFSNGCPYTNASQGTSKRLLFVCSGGLLRSPTAAMIASNRGYNARSCGSSIKIALIPISKNLILWADVVVFMNEENEDKVLRHLSETDKELRSILIGKSICWDVEDIYNYGDDDLVWVLERKLDRLERQFNLQ